MGKPAFGAFGRSSTLHWPTHHPWAVSRRSVSDGPRVCLQHWCRQGIWIQQYTFLVCADVRGQEGSHAQLEGKMLTVTTVPCPA